MRKSTLVALGILLVALVAMTAVFHQYTRHFVPEVRAAKALTAALRADLAEGSTVKLARVEGSDRYAVRDPRRPGLLVEARPAPAVWAADPTGLAFARRLVAAAFGHYGEDRPVEWAQVRLTRPDGTEAPLLALERRGAGVEPLAPAAPAR